jgi:hypothetical protein
MERWIKPQEKGGWQEWMKDQQRKSIMLFLSHLFQPQIHASAPGEETRNPHANETNIKINKLYLARDEICTDAIGGHYEYQVYYFKKPGMPTHVTVNF